MCQPSEPTLCEFCDAGGHAGDGGRGLGPAGAGREGDVDGEAAAAEAAAKQTAKQRAGGPGALSLAATSEKEWDAAVVPESTSGTSGGTRVVQQAGGA